ncbi:MAG: class I SAM-dependent DNA methyltransferase [Armatimonadota bacterium]
MPDKGDATAEYYDLQAMRFDDVPFYLQQLPSPQARVLELGCGTGRVLIPLAAHCRQIVGVDLSEAMLAQCREKLWTADLPEGKARVLLDDIADLDLGETFDYIIAPFRVMQLLITDAALDGLFRTIGRHLAPGGTCILNAFRPFLPRERMLKEWASDKEVLDYAAMVNGGRITRHHACRRLQADPLVTFPEFIFRRYDGDRLVEETVEPLALRCFYAEEFTALIEDHGFLVTACWGGYSGEDYGEGPELVAAFTQEEE